MNRGTDPYSLREKTQIIITVYTRRPREAELGPPGHDVLRNSVVFQLVLLVIISVCIYYTTVNYIFSTIYIIWLQTLYD